MTASEKTPAPDLFPNAAGMPPDEVDALCESELSTAGIIVRRFESFRDGHPEVKTAVFGEHCMWGFRRNWYYWSCSGPGIPPHIAEWMHRRLGKEIRVMGDCTAPSPKDAMHGFAVGVYHIDTQRGLNLFAQTLKLDVYSP